MLLFFINVDRIVVSAAPIADENRAVKLFPFHFFSENREIQIRKSVKSIWVKIL
jgi:hypothetical protein